MLREFTDYTQRELDLRREADNAETFTAHFKDLPEIVFPRIYREYSGRDVLCMQFLRGTKPDSPEARSLSEEERDRLIDLGMVGRFSEELRRTLMYYYFCLVTGDSENAARYLALVAQPLPGGDPAGFRREVEEICRRWARGS